MNDSFFVRRGESVRDLHGEVQRLAHGERPAAQPLPQRLSFEQFGDDVRRAFVRADIEDRQNVGMVQGRGGARLLLEPAQAVGDRARALAAKL